MPKLLIFIFTLIGIILFSGLWLFICISTAYVIKRYRLFYLRHGFLSIILTGILLEVCLSFFCILLSFNIADKRDSDILLGFIRGRYISRLLSPLISIVGAAIGLRRNTPPWRFK